MNVGLKYDIVICAIVKLFMKFWRDLSYPYLTSWPWNWSCEVS